MRLTNRRALVALGEIGRLSLKRPLPRNYRKDGMHCLRCRSQECHKGGSMNPRILVVDDSKTTRRVLSAMVSSRWTVCGEAQNGRSAVRKFRQLEPNLVVLDL